MKFKEYLTNEEKLFMYKRKLEKGLADVERKYADAKAYKNKKVLDKLKKDITKRKKEIDSYDKG